MVRAAVRELAVNGGKPVRTRQLPSWPSYAFETEFAEFDETPTDLPDAVRQRGASPNPVDVDPYTYCPEPGAIRDAPWTRIT